MYQISHGSLENTPSAVVHDMSKLRLRENGLRDEEYDTPVKPSAKALGKRKVIEPVESDRKLWYSSSEVMFQLEFYELV